MTGAQLNKSDFRLDIHTGPHLAVRIPLFITLIHAHCQGRDYRKLGSWEDD